MRDENGVGLVVAASSHRHAPISISPARSLLFFFFRLSPHVADAVLEPFDAAVQPAHPRDRDARHVDVDDFLKAGALDQVALQLRRAHADVQQGRRRVEVAQQHRRQPVVAAVPVEADRLARVALVPVGGVAVLRVF